MEMPLAVKMPKRLKQAAAALYLNNGGITRSSKHAPFVKRKGGISKILRKCGLRSQFEKWGDS